MNTGKKIKRFLIFAIAGMSMLAFGTVSAGRIGEHVIFSEGFESPVVSGYAQKKAPSIGWVKANQGYGSDRQGLINKDSGGFTADDGNNQAYAFRYTNSGMTTAEGYIGPLTLGITYTVSFDVAFDSGGASPYRVQLIAFGAEAARNDCRSTPSGSRALVTVTGNATTSHIGTKVSFDFTPDAVADALDLGKDLGVRFIGATTSALIDNVTVVADFGPVDAGLDAITWSGQEVVLAPNFAEDYTPTTYLWTVDAASAADPNLDIQITGDDTETPTVNIIKLSPIGDANSVTLTLMVSDGISPYEDDSMVIDVYDNSCKAGILTGLKQFEPGDLNSDCTTNIQDFAILALEWLNDYRITSPVPRP